MVKMTMQKLLSSGTQNNLNFSSIEYEGLLISQSEFQQRIQSNSRPKVNRFVATGVVFAAGLMVTGQEAVKIQENPFQGKTFVQPSKQIHQQPSSIGTREKLEYIRTHLGVSLATLAELLGISRSTLYSWLDGELNLQEAKRDRLDLLLKRSQVWAELSPHKPGVLLKSREYDGKTLEAWLQDADTTDDVLKTYMTDVATRAKAQAERLARAITPSVPLTTPVLDRLSMPENTDG